MLWVKAVVGAGLLALGYYVGRETGRSEGIRRDLEGRPRPAPGGQEGQEAGPSAGAAEPRHPAWPGER